MSSGEFTNLDDDYKDFFEYMEKEKRGGPSCPCVQFPGEEADCANCHDMCCPVLSGAPYESDWNSDD